MFAVVQNGEVKQVIQPDVACFVGDKQYSARFIRNASEAERKAAHDARVLQIAAALATRAA